MISFGILMQQQPLVAVTQKRSRMPPQKKCASLRAAPELEINLLHVKSRDSKME